MLRRIVGRRKGKPERGEKVHSVHHPTTSHPPPSAMLFFPLCGFDFLSPLSLDDTGPTTQDSTAGESLIETPPPPSPFPRFLLSPRPQQQPVLLNTTPGTDEKARQVNGQPDRNIYVKKEKRKEGRESLRCPRSRTRERKQKQDDGTDPEGTFPSPLLPTTADCGALFKYERESSALSAEEPFSMWRYGFVITARNATKKHAKRVGESGKTRG